MEPQDARVIGYSARKRVAIRHLRCQAWATISFGSRGSSDSSSQLPFGSAHLLTRLSFIHPGSHYVFAFLAKSKVLPGARNWWC
jgi:hypothetical protein